MLPVSVTPQFFRKYHRTDGYSIVQFNIIYWVAYSMAIFLRYLVFIDQDQDVDIRIVTFVASRIRPVQDKCSAGVSLVNGFFDSC